MAALTKTVDGKSLGADQFAYVGDRNDISTWHLPIDDDHVSSAVKMFGHETHVPAGDKKAAARKIAAAAKKKGIDTKDFESKYCADSAEHADFNGQWIQIFRAGKYPAQGSWDGTATVADLNRVAAGYDPQFHEAPACIGHPKDNLPAYGWADRLKVDGDLLLAKFSQVDPAFESAVTAGRFKKRSAAFYLDAEGKMAGLRHVAFLGAQPPEVKGLKNLNFDDNGRVFTEVDFGEGDEMAEGTDKTIGEQISAWFAEHFGAKQGATVTFSEADVKRIASEAVTAATGPLQTKITALETDLQQKTAKFTERETQLAGSETKQRAIEAANGLKSKGRWIPAFDKMGLPLIFEELAKVTTTIEFGEAGADGKKPQVAPLAMLVNFMEGLPQIVPSGRVFSGEGSAKPGKGTGDALTDMARARQAEKKISFGEALTQIAEEHPELTVPGAGAAGAV